MTIPTKEGTEKMRFAVMRWLNDGNRLSMHNMNQIVEPKLRFNDYKIRTCGLALYKGCPGMWQFRILRIGGKKEMQKWLDSNIIFLTTDATDIEFCEEKAMTEDTGINAVGCSLNAVQSPKRTDNEAAAIDSQQKSDDAPPPTHAETGDTPAYTPELVTEGGSSKFMPGPKRALKSSSTNAGTDSFQYIKRKETAKTDLYKEKIEQLEEDVRSIRRKYRRLEERVNQIEKSTRHPASETPSSDQRTLAKTPARDDKTAEPVDPNQLPADDQHISPQALETTLTNSVKGIIGEQNIVKHLIFQLFTKKEIVSCTRTGKRTIKNMDNVRPPLDPIKFNILERVVLKVTSMQKASFHKKFENQQKVLRRGEKE